MPKKKAKVAQSIEAPYQFKQGVVGELISGPMPVESIKSIFQQIKKPLVERVRTRSRPIVQVTPRATCGRTKRRSMTATLARRACWPMAGCRPCTSRTDAAALPKIIGVCGAAFHRGQRTEISPPTVSRTAHIWLRRSRQ